MVKRDAIQVIKPTDGAPGGVSIPARTSSDPFLVQLFSDTEAAEYDQTLEAVLRIGALAMLDDRISAFLEDAGGLIDSKFEQLKMLHNLRRSEWNRGSEKGRIGEQWVDGALSEYAARVGWNDQIAITGDTGGVLTEEGSNKINKSGDVLAVTDKGRRISIEVKFTDIPEGHLASRDYSTDAKDTAWSQIVEGVANRNADVGFIVFDRSNMNLALKKRIPDIGYLEGAGLVCVVEWERGDRANLFAAYSIARALAHMDNYNRHPEAVAALITQAQAVVKELSQLNSYIDKIIESTKGTEKIALKMSEEIEKHLAALAAIGAQLQITDERNLTARDQIEHFNGAEIMDLVKAHRKRNAAKTKS
jgi:hypothetical protein